MRAPWLTLCALAHAACVPPPEALRLPLGAGDTLIIRYGSGGQVELSTARGGEGELSVPVGDGEVYALQYDCALESLGLRFPAVVDAGGAPPPPGAVRVLSRETGEPAWADRPFTETRLVELRLGSLDTAQGCALLSDSAFPATTLGPARMVLSLGDGRALVGTSLRTFHVLDRPLDPDDGRAVPVPEAGAMPTLGGFRARDGTLYLAGAEPQLGRGVLGSAFQYLPEPLAGPAGRERVWLDGDESGGALVLYLLTDRGSLQRRSGGAWSELARTATLTFGGLAAFPGGALVLGLEAERLRMYREGQGLLDAPPPLTRATALARVRVQGNDHILAAASSGQIYRFSPEEPRWELYADARGYLDALAVVDDRLIVAREDGSLEEVRRDGARCESQASLAYRHPGRALVGIGGGLLVRLADQVLTDVQSLSLFRVGGRQLPRGCSR